MKITSKLSKRDESNSRDKGSNKKMLSQTISINLAKDWEKVKTSDLKSKYYTLFN